MLTLVSNSGELDKLLNKKYEGRIETDPLIALGGSVRGTLDSRNFNITFKGDEYLLISTDSDSRDVLDELLPTLKEVMGGVDPICSYDLQAEDCEEKDSMPTIEWDVKTPEERIKEIVNGRAFSGKTKIHNLKLHNGKTPEEYLESEEEKAERIKNAKIYGIYPGNISDVNYINNLNEVDLYLAIDALGGYLWRCRHEMSHGRMPEISLEEEQYAMEYMVYQTTKFGVELAEPEIDQHINATPSYRAWYKFYSDHFKHTLTDEQWEKFNKYRKEGKDTSEFMPSGHWTDLLSDTDGKGQK